MLSAKSKPSISYDPVVSLSRELVRLIKFKKEMEIMMKLPFDPALYGSHSYHILNMTLIH